MLMFNHSHSPTGKLSYSYIIEIDLCAYAIDSMFIVK